jgi:hypothetical protein
LDRFLMAELAPGEPLTGEIAERWFKSIEHLSAGTRINRTSILRQFCRYLSYFDPRTCIIHSFSASDASPHIYSGRVAPNHAAPASGSVQLTG